MKPLDDLELFEVLQQAYPEKFPDDTNTSWGAAMEYADGMEFDEIRDLLGRVLMMTPTVTSELSKTEYHAFLKQENGFSIALAKRPAK